VYGPDKGAVLDRLARLRTQALDGSLADVETGRLTVGAFLHRWLDATRPAVAPSTLDVYETQVRLHLIPHLGGVKLVALGPAHVQALLGTLEREGANPAGRQRAYRVLRQAMTQAVRWGLVMRNPTDAVKRPRAPRNEFRTLTAEEARTFLAAAREDRFHALYVLAITTGLRQGELLGLRWEDVDLTDGAVHVRRTLLELHGKLWDGEPKTPGARRPVDLLAIATDALHAHHARMLAEGHPHGRIFCDTDGGPVRKSNLVRRSFRPLLRRAQLPRIRFHDLRHTHATLLLQAGVHPKVVQERLGHSDIGLTLNTYTHVVPSMGRAAAVQLNALLVAPSDSTATRAATADTQAAEADESRL
jgi:integrase